MENTIKNLRRSLQEQGDEKIRESSRRFFKEEITTYGIKTTAVQKTGKEVYAEIRNRSKAEILALCEELLQSGYFEEGIIACNWSYNLRKTYLPEDFAIFERWIDRYVNNWATCDTLCNHTVGEFLEMYPQFLPELYRWARSENRWKRRAAAVSLIIPARRGKFLDGIFEIARLLLHDRDDLVQKGYGWMLKAASEAHPRQVFEFVLAQKATMPRTALRYAIEKMPPERKKEAMSK